MPVEIVEKIKKLLRLSASPYPGEAEAALQAAFRLAARHQVDIETLDMGDEDLNRIVSESCSIGFRLSMEKRLALGLVKAFFNVNPVISYPDVLFVGTQADIAIALHIYEFTTSQAHDRTLDLKRLVGNRFTETRRRSYLHGFFYGLSSQLNAEKETLQLTDNTVALALVSAEKKRAAFVAANIGRTSIVKAKGKVRMSKGFLYQGYVAGKSTVLHAAVAAAPAPRPLLQAASC